MVIGMSRTGNSLRNIKYGLLFQWLNMLLSFCARRVFVSVLSREYLGLEGTFASVLSMISFAELGIGGAITYCLYKPLAEKDWVQTAALVRLFRRVYQRIGVAVVVLGIFTAPFLKVLISELPDIPHIYLIYLLFVVDTAYSYFYSYKQTLLIADQKKYIVTVCNSVAKFFCQILQMLFLWWTGNYFIYLFLKLMDRLLENLIISCLADRFYPFLPDGRLECLTSENKKNIMKNTKALIIHKLATVVVFGTDNMLLAFFDGVVAVGLYSNYCMIIDGLRRIYTQLFQSITASVGNLGAVETPEKALEVYRKVNFAGGWIYGFSTVCLFVLLNPFVELWVGAEYLFDQRIVVLIVLNFYVTGMREGTMVFRDAYGMYWHDRYKAAAEATVNLVASVVLAVPFGTAGIFAGTFISTMTTCFWVEPLVVYRHALHAPIRGYFYEYGVNALVTLLTTIMVWRISDVLPGEGVVLFLEKMAVCAVGGNIGYLLAYRKRKELRYFVELLAGLFRRKKISKQ